MKYSTLLNFSVAVFDYCSFVLRRR